MTTEANNAHQALSDAEYNLKLIKDELHVTQEELAELFDPEGFGTEGEWKKLDKFCLEKHDRECVVCP